MVNKLPDNKLHVKWSIYLIGEPSMTLYDEYSTESDREGERGREREYANHMYLNGVVRIAS